MPSAKAAFAIEEIGNVRLLKSCLLRQPKPRKITFVDAFQEFLSKIFLQYTEFHAASVAPE